MSNNTVESTVREHVRCIYTGTCSEPGAGRMGTACKADGYDDPQSIECEAWLFTPNDSANAYYCAGDDLELQ